MLLVSECGFTCRRCGKLETYRNITWVDGPHRGERVPVEKLKICPGGEADIDLLLCAVCRHEFEIMYRKWWEKKHATIAH